MTSFEKMALFDPVGAQQCRDAGRFDGHTIGARVTDPETSHAAAASIGNGVEKAVMVMFDWYTDLTDDELADHLHLMHPPTVKSARSRLAKRGLLVDTGVRRESLRHRDMIVWAKP